MRASKISYILVFLFFMHFKTFAKTSIVLISDDKQDLHTKTLDVSTSISTETTQMLLSRLSNYQFEKQILPLASIDRTLNSMSNACAVNRIKSSKRTDDTIFSLPLNLYPGVRFYYRKSIGELPDKVVTEDKQLTSLMDFFVYFPTKVLGIAQGRSFGKFIDDEILALNDENVIHRAGKRKDSYPNIMKMLLKNRIDAIVDFPVEIQKDDVVDELKSIKIAGSPSYILGYVACSNSDLGRQVIGDINDALREIYQEKSFYNAHLRYLDSNDLADFDRYFDEIFLKNN